jgi:hypothetical protein
MSMVVLPRQEFSSVGISLTSPLVNQNSNEHVGQILLDVKPIPPNYLTDVDGAISFLISIDSDVEQDTVIGLKFHYQ